MILSWDAIVSTHLDQRCFMQMASKLCESDGGRLLFQRQKLHVGMYLFIYFFRKQIMNMIVLLIIMLHKCDIVRLSHNSIAYFIMALLCDCNQHYIGSMLISFLYIRRINTCTRSIKNKFDCMIY